VSINERALRDVRKITGAQSLRDLIAAYVSEKTSVDREQAYAVARRVVARHGQDEVRVVTLTAIYQEAVDLARSL
jgi:hypothetical protein